MKKSIIFLFFVHSLRGMEQQPKKILSNEIKNVQVASLDELIAKYIKENNVKELKTLIKNPDIGVNHTLKITNKKIRLIETRLRGRCF